MGKKTSCFVNTIISVLFPPLGYVCSCAFQFIIYITVAPKEVQRSIVVGTVHTPTETVHTNLNTQDRQKVGESKCCSRLFSEGGLWNSGMSVAKDRRGSPWQSQELNLDLMNASALTTRPSFLNQLASGICRPLEEVCRTEGPKGGSCNG